MAVPQGQWCDLLAKLLVQDSSQACSGPGPSGLKEKGKQILKELGEYYEKLKWETDRT